MNEALISAPLPLRSTGKPALETAGRFWFITAVIGQWIFAVYVALFYGGAALDGDLSRWNQVLPHGHVPGDTLGNVVVAVHLALAFVVLVCGPLQFMPAVRAHAPWLHRANGRLYLITAVILSAGGIFMGLTRGTVGDVSQHIAIYFNGVLILVCAALAVHFAMTRDFDTHRRWALRLFVVVGGVWFFRVGLMFWMAVNGGPAGFDPGSFTGPFLTALAFSQTLLPLALLELYFRAQQSQNPAARLAVAALLGAFTCALAFGIFVATAAMWLPRL